MSLAPPRQRMRWRTAWTVLVLLIATILPVCEAQDFWGLAILAGLLSSLGIWLSCRIGRPLLSQRMATAIAMVLGGITALISVDSGTIGVYAVANWLIAVAVLKCWQLGTSRDYAHVLMIIGLLLLVGSLVSWQLGFAIALALATILGPWTIMSWHLMAEQERWAKLTGRAGVPAADESCLQRLFGVSLAASVFCSVAAFLVFATFPRMRTPLQPVVRGAARQVTGFSAEARLNDVGRLQTSQRVVMRVRLSVTGQPIGGESLQPYLRGMTYNYYNGRAWETRGMLPTRQIDLPADATLTYFRVTGKADVPGAIEQDYWIESGPLPCLLALASPVALGSQEIHQILWQQDADVLLSRSRLPAAMHYRVLSVPAHLLADAPGKATATASQASSDTAEAADSPESIATRAVEVFGTRAPASIRALAWSLASQVTDQPGAPPPAMHEQVVACFIRYLRGPEFTYSLDPPPRARGQSPLEQFLAVKRGYCEYYATTLAVLCHCVKIPARYVTGFHGGKYNEVGSFYAVRDSDAHSWVEVWLGDRGWTPFDPTPPSTTSSNGASLRSMLANLLDYLQFQWSNWVVAYDVLHRQSLLGTFGTWMSSPGYQREQSWTQFLWMFRELLAGPETLSPLGKLLYWLGLLGVLALSGYLAIQLLQQLLHRWRLHRQTRAARQAGVRFYEWVISGLAQRRLVRRQTETPREFARRVEQALPQMQGRFLELIDHYYAMRYGQNGRTDAGERTAREILRRIWQTKSQEDAQTHSNGPGGAERA